MAEPAGAAALPPDIDPSWPAPDIGMSARFDLPAAGPPRLCLIVAATPRSGSTLLCRALWETGAAGAPCEYFGYEYSMIQMIARLRVGSLHDYVARVLRLRTGPNGVFGCKMHWDSFAFATQVGLLPMLPAPRFVLIEREDRLAQAVSFARALQTGQWAAGHPAAREPFYNPKLIQSLLARINLQATSWRRTLAQHRLERIAVTYEQLAADPKGTAAGILGQLGLVADPGFRLALPPLRPQGDALNRDWIERYRRETGG